MFFLLDQKKPKNQDKPDPSGRFVRPLRAWAQTLQAALQSLERKVIFRLNLVTELQGYHHKGSHPGAWGGMPPGGDTAFLNFWFFLFKQKERTKEKNEEDALVNTDEKSLQLQTNILINFRPINHP